MLSKKPNNEMLINVKIRKGDKSQYYQKMFTCAPLARQVLATFAASAATFGWGCNIGLPTTLISKLRHPEFGLSITDEDASWIGSCLAIGGIFGSLVAGR